MTGWLPSLRIAGVQVRVHLLLLAVPVLLAVTAPGSDGALAWRLGAFAILVGCVLVHELGHALAARARGLAAEVRVHGLGAWARIERREPPDGRPADEWAVALAGPAASLALAAVVALSGLAVRGPWSWSDLTRSAPDPWTVALAVTAGMGVVNLLPVFPLDGGRIVRAVLSPALGHRRATTLVIVAGGILAAGLLVVALRSSDPWAILLLGAGALLLVRAALRERRAAAAA
jgi:Zn-dependent protease